MCGILVYIDKSVLPEVFDSLKKYNTFRGPDAQNTAEVALYKDEQTELVVHCFASELQLRGEAKIIQPHVKDDNVLCWNGEIFSGLEVESHENDGVKLFQQLCEVDTAEDLGAVLGRVEGPYALVFYHAKLQSLYFARDPLGRRSLLIHKPTIEQPCFVLSSVSNGPDDTLLLEEVDTGSLYCLRLSNLIGRTNFASSFNSCLGEVSRTIPNVMLPYAIPANVNRFIPDEGAPEVTSLNDAPDYLQEAINRLIMTLDGSVRSQVVSVPNRCPGQARVAVLFSGGIDSTALCYFAHSHIPLDEPIDLLNVAFENPRKLRVRKEGNLEALPKQLKRERKKQELNATQYTASYMVPDRITGLEEVEELRRVCPNRVWNFVEVNVPYEETQKARAYIESIMFPSRTVMDLSLALALWFASRGVGTIKSCQDATAVPYTSTARVLLNGLGSDELLGGYSRHRTAFTSGGWSAVVEELQLEIDRIPMRNLGRDDRIISSHGKETRHPFLSLDVVCFLAELPVHYKMDPRMNSGLGDKMLLRLAMKKVGLELASSRKKRAMQFGSHSARMEGERRGDVPIE